MKSADDANAHAMERMGQLVPKLSECSQRVERLQC